MTARILSGSVHGVEGIPVTVEVDLGRGLPGFDVVGLPGTAVKESRTRVKTAIGNSGFTVKPCKIIVNLAPADIRKEGPCFDLPIAIGILCCIGVVSQQDIVVLGELALDGRIRPVAGVLPILEKAASLGIKKALVPLENACEAELVEGIEVLAARDLKGAVEIFRTGRAKGNFSPPREQSFPDPPDFGGIKGQSRAKRALEIAAAGGHNLMLLGPPGGGKTLLASSLPGILPPLSDWEKREITRIYSVAGLLDDFSYIGRRPFRHPHHACTPAAFLGGGRRISPGELSLAHLGVLFLDEFTEFRRDVLESLRQPLEERQVVLARAGRRYVFPAGATVVAAANLCPCGHMGDPHVECRCRPGEIARYHRRLSGPILDRFDLILEVPRLESRELFAQGRSEDSAEVRRRVAEAARAAWERNREYGVRQNAELPLDSLGQACRVTPAAKQLLGQVVDRLHLSPRVCHKLLRVARTISDLAHKGEVDEEAVGEAVQLRRAEDFLYSSR